MNPVGYSSLPHGFYLLHEDLLFEPAHQPPAQENAPNLDNIRGRVRVIAACREEPAPYQVR